MTKQDTNSKQGFTIIEVVLVLAIAGLIFLMVFIAWPALQRSQRDTQRRNDYSMLSSEISSYITNNGGKLSKIYGTTPTGKTLDSKYVNKDGTDPNGKDYIVKAMDCGGNQTENGTYCKNAGTPPTEAQVYVVVSADCSGEQNGHTAPAENESKRAFAIYGYLEGGNNTFCSASQ